jgi:hypothetical protein
MHLKTVNLYILICLIFCSCNSKNKDKKFNIKAIETESSKIFEDTNLLDYYLKGDSIMCKANKGFPQLSYKFNLDSTGYILKTIHVYSNFIKIQEITANKHIERKEFRLVDWNFDGYKDISVLDNCGSGGSSYWIWNYSPKTKKYYFNKELSEVLGLEIDAEEKAIIFHYREGYSKENWDSLQYKNNKLTFVKGLLQERWNDNLGNSWIKHSYSKKIKNKLIVMVDSSIIK